MNEFMQKIAQEAFEDELKKISGVKDKVDLAKSLLNKYVKNLTGSKVKDLEKNLETNRKAFPYAFNNAYDHADNIVDIAKAKKARNITRAATAAAALGVGGVAAAKSK